MNLGRETETLAFKTSSEEIDAAVVSIVSILNKHGIGTLYFGVRSDGNVIGQDVSRAILQDVSKAICERIKPSIDPAVTEVILDDRHLIRVVFHGDDAPYSVDGRYYLRSANENRPIVPEQLEAFYAASRSRGKWEKELSSSAETLVDRSAVRSFWQRAVQAGNLPKRRYTCPVILKQFGFISNGYLTNAGEVLFGSRHPVTLRMGIFATQMKN